MSQPGRSASEVFSRRLREVRKRRGWTQAELAEQVSELGYLMHRGTVAKIEAGGSRGENVSLDEVLAFAAALGVAPLHLFVPHDDNDRVAIGGLVNVSAGHARAWVRGTQPLPSQDPQFFWSDVPNEEFRAFHDRAIAQSAVKHAVVDLDKSHDAPPDDNPPA